MGTARRLLLLLLAAAVAPAAARAADYYAQEKCSICHIRESVFFDARFADAERLRDYGEERLCGSCHNGSVRDDRAALWRGAQHPAPGGKGGKPCSGCHSPHTKGGWGVLAGSGVSLEDGGDALCGGCHKGYASKGGATHKAAFARGGCRECHRAHGGTGQALLREGRATLCLRCHPSADARAGGGHPVARAASGPAAGKRLPDCIACHPVHGGGDTAAVVGSQCRGCHAGIDAAGKDARRHPGDSDCLRCHAFHAKSSTGGRGFRGKDMAVDALCGGCHAERSAVSAAGAREKGTHLTYSRDGGGDLCLRCHRIHRSAAGTPLLVSAKGYSCLDCHSDQNTIRETGEIDLAHPVFERIPKGRLDEAARTRRFVLGPAGEIVCRTCHSVHRAARGTALLAPGAEGNSSCSWCHEKAGTMSHGARKEGGRKIGCDACHPVHGKKGSGDDPWKGVCAGCHPRGSSHKLGVADRSGRKAGDFPLFDRKGRRVGSGAISCPTCHEPHGAGGAEKRLRRRYGSTAYLCTACHAKGESVALTPHDLRGLAGKSLCEPCHSPHAGTELLMWGLPGGSAGGWGEGTCAGCHRQKGMASPVAPGGHPLNIVVGRALPPEFPLARPSAQTTGTFTCATCHEVHGTGVLPSGQGAGKLLRAGFFAQDGKDQESAACLPCHTRSVVTHGKAACTGCHPAHGGGPAGGGCVACHKGVPQGQGIAGTHIPRGGGCGGCHAIHQAAPGSGARRCDACHRAQAKMAGSPHAELGDGMCAPCHPAHAAPEKAAIKRRAWEDPVSAADMACLRCHSEGGMAPSPGRIDHPKLRRTVGTNYGATVTLESPVTMFSRLQEAGKTVFPLFDEAGARGGAGRVGCPTCHDPHEVSRSDEPGGSRTRYLRDPSIGFLSDICAPCHRENPKEHARKFHTMPRKSE